MGRQLPSGANAGSGGSGGTPDDNSVTSAKIVDGAIVNADINAAAAIAATKISGTAVTAADTGTVTSTMILNGTILDADVNASAAIAATKIAGTAVTAADTGTVTSTMILDGTIAGGDLAAAIALPNGATGTTQALGDASAKVATDLYADMNLSAFDMGARGFKAWNAPIHAASGTAGAVSQSLYVLKVWLPQTQSITGVGLVVSTAGSSLTTGQNLCTLYNQAGTKQADTADQTAVWTTAGFYAMAFAGAPFSMTGGAASYCWVSVLSNGTTPATFNTVSPRNVMNASSAGTLTGANLIVARNGTAVTSTATITPGNNVITSAISIWVGLY